MDEMLKYLQLEAHHQQRNDRLADHVKTVVGFCILFVFSMLGVVTSWPDLPIALREASACLIPMVPVAMVLITRSRMRKRLAVIEADYQIDFIAVTGRPPSRPLMTQSIKSDTATARNRRGIGIIPRDGDRDDGSFEGLFARKFAPAVSQ